MRWETHRCTRTGDRRSNQDRALVLEDDGEVLLVLADGMGGHARGDLAAEAFVDTFRRRFRARDPLADPGNFLAETFQAAHRIIVAVGRTCQPPVQPLTTGVACLISGDTAHWAHVGDSRLYLLRHDRVIYRTRDHTPVAELLDAGLISHREARRHPMRNHVSRCIGSADNPPEVSLGPTAFLEPGDTLLLCSDGFWSALGERRLLALPGAEDLAATLETLALTAEQLAHPNSDNITAVACRLQATDTDDEFEDSTLREADEVLARTERLLGR